MTPQRQLPIAARDFRHRSTWSRRHRPLCAPKKARISCAGRTDKGVSAVGQVLSFSTWNELTPAQVLEAVNTAADAAATPLLPPPHATAPEPEPEPQPRPARTHLRAVTAERVDRSFHATFGAQWRQYLCALLPIPTPFRPASNFRTLRTNGAFLPLCVCCVVVVCVCVCVCVRARARARVCCVVCVCVF